MVKFITLTTILSYEIGKLNFESCINGQRYHKKRLLPYLGALHVLLELLHVALELGPPVLEPRDDLSVGQPQLGGDLVAIGGRQVLLVEEPLLQLEDLMVGEGRP